MYVHVKLGCLINYRGESFRPAYSHIVELRSFFTSTPMLLLSATCTQSVRDKIVAKLQLNEVVIQWDVPDR